ncbi:hypothetical protein DH2020_013922 [Rehmannia glutinosa]|uniref:Major facilitator superfamily (MFS) profile domain-containing protein n=1 Tax=Rehmannia glutinosa TaxID=99300 RepID=A0ABR0WY27_REHGL
MTSNRLPGCRMNATTTWSKSQTRPGGGGVWKDIFVHPTRPVLHITIAAIGVQFLQQASGIDAVGGACCSSLAAVAWSVALHAGHRIDRNRSLRCRPTYKWLVAVCVVATYAAVAFFSMGMGPVAWVYSSEVFPLRLRAQGCGMGVAINRLTSGVILMSFISLYDAITIGGAFYLFTGIAVLTWIFFFTLLPETRGRTLEDMEVLFGSFFGWRNTMRELRKKESANPNDGDA